ncbi:phosphate signaling complex protein PhoU [Marihabitans asiaticum]|uniref:Phosphate-specific transport system accessory protein PhoU n=1 Tax=Marihabitans asiaticum TaxID=415218 RepID=A0A560WHL4_9MICO|nr:phosphate signaling complex protein PhoU [Marihabitans asiaticum]TWD17004.1 PhoU-like phosphate uptake regulator [Marihabitans asiaticum]
MREVFHDELQQITDDLVGMSSSVRVAIQRGTEALLRGDVKLAEQVIDEDRGIDDLRTILDAHAVDLLARQSPVATDLRTIVTSMRMSADLERMGDLARHVAKLTRLRFPDIAVPEPIQPIVREMNQICLRIVDQVGTCLRTQDLDVVEDLERIDDELDELHRRLYEQLVDGHWEHGTESAVDMALLGRYYERFGDHGVSVARRVRYLVTGEEFQDRDD